MAWWRYGRGWRATMGKPLGYEVQHCPCLHEPDWSTVRFDEGTGDIIDVWCRKCGLSGAFTVDPKDIQWDNLPKEKR
jgi:hypothetical protein